MHLRSLTLQNFRAAKDLTVDFDRHLTIVAGENNSGKSTILDAIRLLTHPLDDRRDLCPREDDVTDGSEEREFCVTGEFANLTDAQVGLNIAAVGSLDEAFIRYGFRYVCPAPGRRRGEVTFWAGQPGAGDPEPEARRLIRHVHLPALRDAQRVLASGSSDRIALMVRHVAGRAEAEGFEETAAAALGGLNAHGALEATTKSVQSGLRALTEGVSPQETSLSFAAARLEKLARDLRFRLSDEGVEPADLERSGLGYANLLYMATVLAELEAASDADLTLLLVEEPEAHLHPQLQLAVIRHLEERARLSQAEDRRDGEPAGHIQVIVTTHSPNVTAAVSISRAVILTGATALEDGSDGEDSPNGRRRRYTAALPVGGLGLEAAEVAKLDRYLNVTRSALLFSRRALLLEGISEAILLRTLARRVLPPGDESVPEGSTDQIRSEINQRNAKLRLARSRFNSACVVPIDGVDFAPYLRLLLSECKGQRLADEVVVITDEDPRAPGDRKRLLEKVAANCGAPEALSLFVGSPTLEAALFLPENAEALGKAFKLCHPRSDADWEGVMAKSVADRGPALVGLLKDKGTRKGDFAQALEAVLSEGIDFVVPKYLGDAIRCAAGA